MEGCQPRAESRMAYTRDRQHQVSMSAQHLRKETRFQTISPSSVAHNRWKELQWLSKVFQGVASFACTLGCKVSRQERKVDQREFPKREVDLHWEDAKRDNPGDISLFFTFFFSLVPCRHPILGGLIENSYPPALQLTIPTSGWGSFLWRKIEVAIFGILIQSIWWKILFAMACGLMIFNLK